MGHSGHVEIRNPGKFKMTSGLQTLLIFLVVIGAASFAFLLKTNADRAWSSFLMNHFYFMSLALGGLFFAAIQWITGAMWSAPVRRVAEAFTAYLPVALIPPVVVCASLAQIYPHWMDSAKVAADPMLAHKAGYLNAKFFTIRNILGFLILLGLGRYLIGNSLKQDTTKSYAQTETNRKVVPIFLILFGILFTMMSFDQLMSLNPHWFSTIFGIYLFAGMYYSTHALLAILTVFLRNRGYLNELVNENHLHDIGKFMFAFTIFWAYIAFSQFMLIWYANLPEETIFFLPRLAPESGWFYISAFLLIGKFFVPFLGLIRRDVKRNERVLVMMGVFMLFAQWIDILWLVQPNFFVEGPKIGLGEIGMFAGFWGLFLLIVFRFLSKNNVVAIGDPRLQDSQHHHQ